MLVGDDFDFFAFHDGDHRIRGAQVDADDLAHSVSFPQERCLLPWPSPGSRKSSHRGGTPRVLKGLGGEAWFPSPAWEAGDGSHAAPDAQEQPGNPFRSCKLQISCHESVGYALVNVYSIVSCICISPTLQNTAELSSSRVGRSFRPHPFGTRQASEAPGGSPAASELVLLPEGHREAPGQSQPCDQDQGGRHLRDQQQRAPLAQLAADDDAAFGTQ